MFQRQLEQAAVSGHVDGLVRACGDVKLVVDGCVGGGGGGEVDKGEVDVGGGCVVGQGL